jgi:hypothetical protein
MSVSWGDLQKLSAEAGFSNMPHGEHEVEITKAEHKKTTNGKDMYSVIFKVVLGQPSAGATQPNNFVISPESPVALGFFFKHMAALGLDANYFATNPTKQQVAAALVGRRARITVGPGRNDADRTEVSRIGRATLGTGAAPGLSVFAPVPQATQAAALSVPPPPPITHAQPVVPPAVPAPAVEPATTPQDAPNAEAIQEYMDAMTPHEPDQSALTDALTPPDLPF